MKSLKYIGLSLAIVLGLGFSGCGASQKVPVPDVNKVIAKDKAIIEVHRTSSFYGAARAVDIYDNGILIGSLDSDSKLLWERGVDKILCFSITQDSALTATWLDPFFDRKRDPSCFEVKAGTVNKFKYNYSTAFFVPEEEFNKQNQ
jgi:hypothetical protein